MPPETPAVVSPAPVTVTPEMSMFEFPLFVRVELRELLLPTVTVLKFRLVGFALKAVDAVEPLPDKLITSWEGSAFVVNVTDPLTVAVEVGVKMALKARLAEPPMVLDVERPLMLKPVPVVLTRENLIMLLPLFWSVMVCELLVPMTTLPKLTLAGVAEICVTLLAGFPLCPPLPADAVVYPAQLERLMEATMTNSRTISTAKVPMDSLLSRLGARFSRIANQCSEPLEFLSTGRRAKQRATRQSWPTGQAHLTHFLSLGPDPVFAAGY